MCTITSAKQTISHTNNRLLFSVPTDFSQPDVPTPLTVHPQQTAYSILPCRETKKKASIDSAKPDTLQQLPSLLPVNSTDAEAANDCLLTVHLGVEVSNYMYICYCTFLTIFKISKCTFTNVLFITSIEHFTVKL